MAFHAPDSALPISFAGTNWDNTLGALLIGVLVSGMLFGLTCMQAYTYFERARESDGKRLKGFVACLWCVCFVSLALQWSHDRVPSCRLLDALDFALNCHTAYFFLVTNYTNPLALSGKIPWSLALHVLITVRPFLAACADR